MPHPKVSVVVPSLRAIAAHPPWCAACASGAETKGSFPQWPRASRSPFRVLEHKPGAFSAQRTRVVPIKMIQGRVAQPHIGLASLGHIAD